MSHKCVCDEAKPTTTSPAPHRPTVAYFKTKTEYVVPYSSPKLNFGNQKASSNQTTTTTTTTTTMTTTMSTSKKLDETTATTTTTTITARILNATRAREGDVPKLKSNEMSKKPFFNDPVSTTDEIPTLSTSIGLEKSARPKQEIIVDDMGSTADLLLQQQQNVTNDIRRPCIDFNPCKHGTCQINNKTKEFMCQCNVGYMGPFCDLMRHPCDFKPCENGICEIVGDLYYKCLCKPNFTGVNCHIEIKPCQANTCLNGGKCKSLPLEDVDYPCDCPANFTGTYCETG